jgi:hypothetical protein
MWVTIGGKSELMIVLFFSFGCFRFKYTPAFMLRGEALSGLPRGEVEASVANSMNFIVDELKELKQMHLASRMTLTHLRQRIGRLNFDNKRIFVLDVRSK